MVPETFRHIFNGYDGNEFAGMAPPANRPVDLSGWLTVDCGATTTLTESFNNMTNITPKVVTIQLAAAGATMKLLHVGTMTYYVYDRTGTLRPVHTKAYYVKELNQDLLAGRGLTNSDYRVILDKHESIAGIYPVGDDGTIDPANSFPFVSDYSEGLFYLRTEPIDATKYARLSGYNLWHRRFGHCPNENIRKTIPFSIGLDELHSHRFDPHEKCPACMMGKSHLNNKPGRKERSDKPLSRVYMDIFSSSVTSIEGHNYALVITDDCTGYRWLYGLKTKDDILRAVKKWYSDIAVLRETHTLLVVLRDNAGENKSKEIIEFFESMGVENRYATPYEQWQDGQAESSINSLMTLARSVMVESGLGGQFWFSAAMAAKDARNVTYKERIRMTPYLSMYGKKKDISKFRAFGCQAYMYLNEERRGKGKHIPRAVEAINLGFASDHNISWYKLYHQ